MGKPALDSGDFASRNHPACQLQPGCQHLLCPTALITKLVNFAANAAWQLCLNNPVLAPLGDGTFQCSQIMTYPAGAPLFYFSVALKLAAVSLRFIQCFGESARICSCQIRLGNLEN